MGEAPKLTQDTNLLHDTEYVNRRNTFLRVLISLYARGIGGDV